MDRYAVWGQVGEGAFAVVLGATCRASGAVVALKRLPATGPPRTPGPPAAVAREVAALSRLAGHPHVIRLLDVVPAPPYTVLCLEYMPTDLARVLVAAPGGLPTRTAKAYVRMLMSGLAHVHAAGLMHRDIKPANLLLAPCGLLQIADFGQARAMVADLHPRHKDPLDGVAAECQCCGQRDGCVQRDARGGSVGCGARDGFGESNALTTDAGSRKADGGVEYGHSPTCAVVPGTGADVDCRSRPPGGAVSGTADERERAERDESPVPGPYTHQVASRWYRAPELLYGSRSYDHGVDLWAAGCVCGEMLTGHALFPGTSDIQQLQIVTSQLGSPTAESWPVESRPSVPGVEAPQGHDSLPDWGKIVFDHTPGRPLESLVGAVGPDALHLVGSLLCYDSARRLSAAQVAAHSWFDQEPLALPLADLPQFDVPTPPPPTKQAATTESLYSDWDSE